MTVTGTTGRLRQPWPLDLAFDIRHPRAREPLRWLVETWQPRGQELGSLALRGRLSGDNTVLQIDALNLTAGASTVTGSVSYTVGPRPRALTPNWRPAS